MEKKISRVGVGGCFATNEVLDYADSHNIKLIDLGWGYQGPNKFEKQFGEWFKDKKREDYFIVDKLPLFNGLYTDTYHKSLYLMSDADLEECIKDVLKKQLEYTNAKYFDAYLLHAIFDMQHSQNYDIDADINLYKRLTPILLKLKEKGLIKKIGFSAHITYERLLMFLNEVDPENKVFEVAEVSFNSLNDKGANCEKPSAFISMHGLTVWDAIGEKGIHYLKEKGYTIIDMMPHESGRMLQLTTAPDWYRWNDTLICNNKDIDYVLVGTTNPAHIDEMLVAAGEMEDPSPVPDMRTIDSGVRHCHE